METSIRFAPLIRVSTEKQKKKGESLLTQETQIRQYVELLKGVIPDVCWRYKGQEHSTPGFDRALLDQLLEDSGKDLFDAVIVTESSRWSRDNLRSEQGLNTLAKNGIRFFVSLMEYDLHNPEHRFILGMSTSINQLQATKQSINSITNRIERAKRNVNSAGRLPYGRTFDKKTGLWDIDPVKKRLIEEAARRYLNGEKLPDIARTLKFDHANLHRILTKFSGTKRTTTFKYGRINEKIEFTIPALLDEKTIQAVKERAHINRTYTRGDDRKQYLLTGFIYCAKCGLTLKARTNESGKEYYLHSKYRKDCRFNKYLKAPEIEASVLLQLIKTFGDPELIEKAIKQASPDMSKVEALNKEKASIDIELKRISAQKSNLISKVADNLLSNEEIEGTMSKLREQEKSFKDRLLIVETELSSTHDPEHIKRLSKWTGKVISDATRNNPLLIFERPFKWKRKLIERAFSGVNIQGEHLGVYITRVGEGFEFEIKGQFENTINTLPLTDETLMDAFNIDPQYQDVSVELQKIRTSLLNIQSKYIICSAG
jgi:site-specific DNA recombinase